MSHIDVFLVGVFTGAWAVWLLLHGHRDDAKALIAEARLMRARRERELDDEAREQEWTA